MTDRPDRPSILQKEARGPLGEWLAGKLTERKITGYRHAANVLGVSHSQVRSYIRGESRPSLDTIYALADKLGVESAEIERKLKDSPVRRPAIDVPPASAISDQRLLFAFYGLANARLTDAELAPVLAAAEKALAETLRKRGGGDEDGTGHAGTPTS